MLWHAQIFVCAGGHRGGALCSITSREPAASPSLIIVTAIAAIETLNTLSLSKGPFEIGDVAERLRTGTLPVRCVAN